jgi:putative transposase
MEDLDRRMMGSWARGPRRTDDGVLRAGDQAVRRDQPPRGGLPHSDRGRPETRAADPARLRADGRPARVSRAGHGDDHACREFWHRLLKNELCYPHRWATRDEAQHAIFPDIEIFAHRQRLQSALGTRTSQALAGGLTRGCPKLRGISLAYPFA